MTSKLLPVQEKLINLVYAESYVMCTGAIIKAGIVEVFYGAPHENNSNPEIYLQEINESANPKLKIQGRIMGEKFLEQIKRGRTEQLKK
jgi:tRNA(Arg) A34 adenosine deaminase TadA